MQPQSIKQSPNVQLRHNLLKPTPTHTPAHPHLHIQEDPPTHTQKHTRCTRGRLAEHVASSAHTVQAPLC